MQDKSIDDKIVKVDRKNAIDSMYRALKVYHKQEKQILNAKAQIVNFLNDAQMYESLGFRVDYFFNKDTGSYTFTYQEKDKIGFKPRKYFITEA